MFCSARPSPQVFHPRMLVCVTWHIGTRQPTHAYAVPSVYKPMAMETATHASALRLRMSRQPGQAVRSGESLRRRGSLHHPLCTLVRPLARLQRERARARARERESERASERQRESARARVRSSARVHTEHTYKHTYRNGGAKRAGRVAICSV